MYQVDPLDPSVGDLPDDLLADFAELRTALEVSPRTVGQPYLDSNPTGIRTVAFGSGRALLTFGVIEHDRRVFLISLVIAP